MSRWPGVLHVDVDLDFGTAGCRRFGRISYVQNTYLFEMDSDFARSEINPAPYTLERSIARQEGSGAFGGLHPVFSDSEPDGWTKYLVERRVAAAGFSPRELTKLDRLALVGGAGLGALSYKPQAGSNVPLPQLGPDDLAELVTTMDDMTVDQIELAEKVAGSLGGMQPKAHIWSDGSIVSVGDRPGLAPWIIKFPSLAYQDEQAGVIEYAYSQMARRAGIDMPKTALIKSAKGPGYFAVERFDRIEGRRLHYQSYAGLYGIAPMTSSTYGHLFQTADALVEGSADQMIRRMAFNVLAVNRDDHVRNHGFLMDSAGTWTLAPAFDLTFNPNRHILAVGDARDMPPRLHHMREAARQGGYGDGEVARIVQEVRRAVRTWPELAREAGVSDLRTDTIWKAMLAADPAPPHAAIFLGRGLS